MNKPVIDASNAAYTIKTIESHTVGEPTRIVYSGFPEPLGSTMMEKKEWLSQNYDKLRTAVLCEPRGHKDMVGALLTKPCNPEADLGVIFMDAYRWINMCGHASMGVAYVAVKNGIIPTTEKATTVKLDTPAGLVSVTVNLNTGTCTLCNVPSYLALKDCKVNVGSAEVPFNVAFGGTFFALVDLKSIGISLKDADIQELVSFARRFLKEANEKYTVSHPFEPITRIVNAEFYEKDPVDKSHFHNIVISEQGEIDRSPCGTGTSAELAELISTGEITQFDVLKNTNFLGAEFQASVKETTSIGKYQGIIPEVTGKAYITGKAEYYLFNDDPLTYGFNIF